ncbi:MAG: hypothetical protein Tsb0034_25110 [Ekhidna sp.]
MHKKNTIGFFSFSFVFLLSISSIGLWIERDQTVPLLLAFATAFVSYLFLLQEKQSPNFLLGIGILARLSLFFSLPSLSDDIYRFIWDGLLVSNGIHPFSHLPDHFLHLKIEGLSSELYSKLNSPNYFTIYPPLNQFIFWMSVEFDSNWLTTTNVIRTLLLLAEIGSFLALRKLLMIYNKSPNGAFWYFLNPLVILEIVGNVHMEGLVIFFLLAGLYFYKGNKNILSGIHLGLAIGTKLLPLIYLPYLFLKGLKNKKWSIPMIAGIVGLTSLLPLISPDFLSGMSESLNLYFQSFEFNASLYFIAREIGFLIYGYNNIALIGPLLASLSFLSIIAISLLAVRKKWSLPQSFLFILSIYLIFATTVHPWYILPLVVFGALSGYWYPIVWSGLIFLTYAGYSENGFELPMFIVVMEYMILSLVALIELRFRHVND